MDDSINSKLSHSDDPLVPDEIDDEYFKQLTSKINEIIRFLRQQKDNQQQQFGDNIQRLLVCGNRFKSQYDLKSKECQELVEEITNLKMHLDDAEKLNEINLATINELRHVIEDAWRQKDAAHIREQTTKGELAQAKEMIEQLEENIKSLNDARSPYKLKEDIIKERERMQNELNDLKKRLQMQRNYTSELEETIQITEVKVKNFIRALDETSTEAYHSKKRIEVLSKQVTEYETENGKLSDQILELKQQTEKLTKMKVRHNLQILSLKTNMQHLNSQNNNITNKLAKITVDLEYAIQERDKYKRSLTQKNALLKMREEENIKYRQENSKLNKLQDSASRKCTNVEEAKKLCEQENLRLKTQLNTQEKEYEAIRRLIQQMEQKNNQLILERDTLKRELLLERKHTEETEQLLQESHHEIRSLKDTILYQERKHRKLLDEFMQLKGEKAKKLEEIQTLLDKIDNIKDKIHLKESYEMELKRTICDTESEKIKCQTQYNHINNEYNALQRNYNNLGEEINKLKVQLNEQGSINENLKTKISLHESDVNNLQLQNDKIEKEKRLLKTELRYNRLQHQHTKAELMEKKKFHDKCTKTLIEDQQNIKRLQRDFDNLINEKNTLNSNLNKKDDELQKLQKEMDKLQNSYNQLQHETLQKQKDFNLMSIELKNLYTERDILRKDRESAINLRHELLQMHRKLNQARIKARALQDEMLTPMNIHRWRTLQGKDPQKMDLIRKLQSLRKQLLQYNVASLEQNRALRESQYLCDALKEFMAKLPNINIKNELNHVKATLYRRDKRLKSLKAEIDAKCLDERNIHVELESLKTNLSKTKEQLLEERKAKERLLNERNLLMQMHLPTECLSAPPHFEERSVMITN